MGKEESGLERLGTCKLCGDLALDGDCCWIGRSEAMSGCGAFSKFEEGRVHAAVSVGGTVLLQLLALLV